MDGYAIGAVIRKQRFFISIIVRNVIVIAHIVGIVFKWGRHLAVYFYTAGMVLQFITALRKVVVNGLVHYQLLNKKQLKLSFQ